MKTAAVGWTVLGVSVALGVVIGLAAIAIRGANPSLADTLAQAALLVGLGGGAAGFVLLVVVFIRHRRWAMAVAFLGIVILCGAIAFVVVSNFADPSRLVLPPGFTPVAVVAFVMFVGGLAWAAVDNRRSAPPSRRRSDLS